MTGCACFDDHSFYCHDSMTLYAVKLDEFRLDTHPSFWCSIIYIAKVYSFFFTFTSGLKKQIFMLVFCFLSIGKRDHKITTKQIQLKEAIRCTPPILFVDGNLCVPLAFPSLFCILVTPDLMQWCSASDAVETWKRTKHLSLWHSFFHAQNWWKTRRYPTLIEHHKPSYII